MISIRLIGFASLIGAALTAPLTNKGGPPAQENAAYRYHVVASGLASPTELRLGGDRTLYIAQQPKAPRDASLAKLELDNGEITQIGTGSAVLAGFAANREGRLYWVDGAKGTLMSQSGPHQAPSVIHKGDALPATAIAVDASDRIYIARKAPLKNGSDTAAVLVRGSSLVAIPDPGGPAKTSLAASSAGDLYWTSSAEGVIYHVSPEGKGNVVVAGLDKPQGLTLDAAEDTLYFTELPTPGIPGDSGGRNTVNALDLATLKRTVIQRGDPQPTGVAVASSGTVYWTSTNRGLVVAAVPVPVAAAAAQFTATLVGAEAVPPVTTRAQGLATFNLTKPTRAGDDDDDDDKEERSGDRTGLNYQVTISNIGRVRRVEIHQGAKGEVGPLVARLSRGEGSEDERDSSNGYASRGRLRARDLRGPFADDWSGFISALSQGNLYVNVLTRNNPNGEVRGQIVTPGTPPGNQAPVGVITVPATNVTVQAGQSVDFAGTATDPNGDAVTVLWDFGDGTTSAALTPGAHVYPSVGTFTARFTATDANGLADPNPPTRIISVQPVVVNQPPDAMIITPATNATITAGQSVSFSGTTTDPNGDAVTVLWNFGDGSTSTLLAPGAHVYAAVGTFTVTLTGTDSRGLADPTPASRTITVQAAPVNGPPNGTITAPAANVTINAGQSVAFSGTATDPDGNPVSVLWNFGDGTTSTLLVPGNHTYAAIGTFNVTLVATDSLGLADPTPATRTITVQAAPVNGAPNGTITAPAANVTINAGQAVAFSGTATDPNSNPVAVLWNFGDGTTSTLLAPGNHTYASAGTFTVTLTATDSLGLADPTPATRTITVNPVVVAATLTQIQATLFTPSCTGCHDAGGSAGLNLTAGSAFSNLVNVPATTSSGVRVAPGNPGASVLVTFLASGHRSVSAANQALISSWITGGALNN